jgi:hypothetical protein
MTTFLVTCWRLGESGPKPFLLMVMFWSIYNIVPPFLFLMYACYNGAQPPPHALFTPQPSPAGACSAGWLQRGCRSGRHLGAQQCSSTPEQALLQPWPPAHLATAPPCAGKGKLYEELCRIGLFVTYGMALGERGASPLASAGPASASGLSSRSTSTWPAAWLIAFTCTEVRASLPGPARTHQASPPCPACRRHDLHVAGAARVRLWGRAQHGAAVLRRPEERADERQQQLRALEERQLHGGRLERCVPAGRRLLRRRG